MADVPEQKLNFPQGKHIPFELGASWSERKIIIIKYDFKPASIDLSNAILQHNADGSVVIKVPDVDGSGSATTVYTGHSYEPKAGFLHFDVETGKYVLERINYAYRVKYTRAHNVATGPEVPNSGDRRKASQEVKIPSSSMSSARQSTSSAAAAPTQRSSGTPSSTSSRRGFGRLEPTVNVPWVPQSEEKQPPHVYFMTDSEDENVVSSTTGSSSSDGDSSSSSSGASGGESDDESLEHEGSEEEEEEEEEEEGRSNNNNNSTESKRDGSLMRPSLDCSSRSSSKHRNTSTRKPQLSSCISESEMEVNFDDTSSNFGPASSSQPERNNSSRDSVTNDFDLEPGKTTIKTGIIPSKQSEAGVEKIVSVNKVNTLGEDRPLRQKDREKLKMSRQEFKELRGRLPAENDPDIFGTIKNEWWRFLAAHRADKNCMSIHEFVRAIDRHSKERPHFIINFKEKWIDYSKEMWMKPRSGLLIFDESRQFIVVVRGFSSNSYFFPGGAVEEGESQLAAATREGKEELGHEFVVTEANSYSGKDLKDRKVTLFVVEGININIKLRPTKEAEIRHTTNVEQRLVKLELKMNTIKILLLVGNCLGTVVVPGHRAFDGIIILQSTYRRIVRANGNNWRNHHKARIL